MEYPTRKNLMAGIDDLMRSAQEERKSKSAGVYKKSRQKREEEISRVEEAEDSADTLSSSSQETQQKPESKRRGRPAGVRTAKLTLTMEPDLRRKFKAYCAINELTASDVFNRWADRLIRKWEKEHYLL